MASKMFKGERRYLSNMFKVPIAFKGELFNSSEAIYMLFKNDSLEWRDFILTNDPKAIKVASREIEMSPDWDKRRIPSMKLALILKFSQHPELLRKLKLENELIEWNTWGDRFWGIDVVSGVGANNLGMLLKEVSEMLPEPILDVIKTGDLEEWYDG